MKQKLSLLIVATLLLFYQKIQAQNTSPFWSLAGNSNTNSTSKLGTTNAMPLRLLTNNVERIRIVPSGKVGIGTINPAAKLTIFNNGSVPAANWAPTASIFAGYAEAAGTGDYYLLMASNTVTTRPNVIGRRARGSLNLPLAVVKNDFVTSFQASAYDGTLFQNAANIDFFVDGTPTSGHVPIRISFSTGTNLSNRTERVRIGSTGNISFNSSQFYIDYASGRVGIGTLIPNNKLEVRGGISANNSNDSVALNGITASSSGVGVFGSSRGVYFKQEDIFSGGIGVVGKAVSLYGGTGVRGQGSSYAGTGVEGIGGDNGGTGVVGTGGKNDYSTGVYGSGTAYGVDGLAEGDYGIGLNAVSAGLEGIGVNAYSSFGVGVFGATGNPDSYAGYFDGDVYSAGVYQGSDLKLKQNITALKSAMNIINLLQPKVYEYRQDSNFKNMNLPIGKRFGLIAQDVEEILPELVKATKFVTRTSHPPGKQVPGKAPESKTETSFQKIDFKAINYIELIPVMIRGIQEHEEKILKQQQENEELRARITKLEKLVSRLTGDKVHSGSLFQNTPNPVKGSTRISYFLPEGGRNAKIVFTDVLGKTIKTIAVSASGIVDFDASNLTGGIYNYSLIIDNVTIETLRMTVIR